MGVVNRKKLNTTLSFGSAAKLETMANRSGQPKTKVLDDAVDTLYEKKGEQPVAQHKGIVLTMSTNKGGAGKTTSTAAFADVLAKRGNRVLVIDTDPQGNLSIRFGYNPMEMQKNYLGALIRDRMGLMKDEDGQTLHRAVQDYINPAKNAERIDIMISDIRLDGDFAVMNASNIAGTSVLRNIVRELKKLDVYDFILIDTRPTLNNEVAAAFIATDYVLIPVVPAKDALFGANATIQFIIQCRQANPTLKLLGVFMTKVYDRNTSFHVVAPVINKSWPDALFQTMIPKSQDAVNAENESLPVTTARFANKKLAKRYELLVEEALNRMEKEATLDGHAG